MPEPVKQIVLNKELRLYGNGKLPNALLEAVRGGGKMYAPAAKFFNLMVRDATVAGFNVVNVSEGYRSFLRQEMLFADRYSRTPTLRKPSVTRVYNGKKYWLKRGKAPSAVPGTSPHGWGLAQDINVGNPRFFKWLCENAPKYGFYLQGKKYLPNGSPNPEYEPWHWQFCHL